MNTPTQSDFWKNNSIVIIALAVILLTVVFTNLSKISDLFSAEKFAGSYVARDTGFTGKSILPSVSREKLNTESIIYLTNKERAENGLPPLMGNQLLNKIAELRARDMLEKQYFDHVSPTGQQASDLAEDLGYHYKIIAENISSGDFITNKKIVDGWMQSPGHRENILSTDVQEIGAAVLKGKMKGLGTYVAVQIFGLQSHPVKHNVCAAPSDNLLNDIELKKAEIQSLQDKLNRLKKELDAEQESIETDKKYTYDDAQKTHNLNVRIDALNEKSRWYNRIVEEAKAKVTVTESMVSEYNRVLQAYNECHLK